MTAERINELLEQLKREAPTAALRLPVECWVVAVAQIQLALRHEENTGPAAGIAREVAQSIIDGLRPKSAELADFLETGFDPRYDIIR